MENLTRAAKFSIEITEDGAGRTEIIGHAPMIKTAILMAIQDFSTQSNQSVPEILDELKTVYEITEPLHHLGAMYEEDAKEMTDEEAEHALDDILKNLFD